MVKSIAVKASRATEFFILQQNYVSAYIYTCIHTYIQPKSDTAPHLSHCNLRGSAPTVALKPSNNCYGISVHRSLWAYTGVCVCVYTHTHTYIHTRARTHIHTHTHKHTHTSTHTHTQAHTHTHTHTHSHTHKHTHTHSHTNTHTLIHTHHTHTHTLTHTTHTHTHDVFVRYIYFPQKQQLFACTAITVWCM